jgi:hypothetical protein
VTGAANDPIYALSVKVLGADARQKPPRHFLELLYGYAPDPIAYLSDFDSDATTWTVYWLTETGLGVITCRGSEDSAAIEGSYRPLTRVSSVKLGADVRDQGLRAEAKPNIWVQFENGDEFVIPSIGLTYPEPGQFVTALLARL